MIRFLLCLGFLTVSSYTSVYAVDWSGHIHWKSSVRAIDPEQKEMAQLVTEMAPSFQYDCSVSGRSITFSELNRYAREEEYILSTWHIDAAGDAWFVRTAKNIRTGKPRSEWFAAKANDLDRDTEQIVKDFLAAKCIYSTKIEKIGDGGVIAGLQCTRYRVVKSEFVRVGAQAELWIHDGFTLPRARWQCKVLRADESARKSLAASPIPLSIPVDSGVILKVVVLENGVEVMYEATKVQEGKAQHPIKDKK